MPPLIDAAALARLQGPLVLLDCRAHLTQPELAREAYRAGHIPGAVHADLERDLSDMQRQGQGRHPLPEPIHIVARFAGLGVRDDSTVVLYDTDGAMYAARGWWMLRAIGHTRVAVLDGGLAAWQALGLPLETGEGPSACADHVSHDAQGTTLAASPALSLRRSPEAWCRWVCEVDEVERNLQARTHLVLDARSPERFRGEGETLDPRAGHIPGARNRFFRHNLDAEGRFLPAAQLRQAFGAVLGHYQPEQVISQCGSGVTACHNLLAMAVAGLEGARLYPGSWSQWCSVPTRPIATGEAL